MTRRIATRTTLVTLGLATLAACIVNLSFAMDKPSVALKSDAGTTNIAEQKILVDLGEYKEITDHKDNIKSLDLDYVDDTTLRKALSRTSSAFANGGEERLERAYSGDEMYQSPSDKLKDFFTAP